MVKKISSAVLATLVLASVLFAFWVGGTIMENSASDTPSKNKPADYVIILGCRLDGDKPGKALSQRIDAAVEYLNEQPSALVVCSGGQGNDEEISEAYAISLALQDKGIARSRIILEDKSHNTFENLSFSKKILTNRRDGLPYSVYIATSDYHVYRTRRLANYVGFVEPMVMSAKSSATVFYPGFIREIAAVIRSYFVFR